MIWKFLIALSALAIVIGGIVWIADGMEFYTKNREQVKTLVKDELFGTTSEQITWVPTFKYGLMPDGAEVGLIHRSYAFVLGFGASLIVGSTIMLRRRRKTS